MGDTSRNLSRREFACRCGCGLDSPHPFLVVGIQWTTDELRLPTGAVNVTSGCRCHDHNAAIPGAAPHSQHVPQPPSLYCFAADVQFKGVDLEEAFGMAQRWSRFASGGIGVYIPLPDGRGGPPRLHLDVRSGVARWGVVAVDDDGARYHTEKVTLSKAFDAWRRQRGRL